MLLIDSLRNPEKALDSTGGSIAKKISEALTYNVLSLLITEWLKNLDLNFKFKFPFEDEPEKEYDKKALLNFIYKKLNR